jgi:hypothetical protein
MMSKNASLEAAGHNCIDAPKFQDADRSKRSMRERRASGRFKKGCAGKKWWTVLETPESPAGIPRNRPPLPKGGFNPPNKNKCSETAEITGKLGENINGLESWIWGEKLRVRGLTAIQPG